MRCAIHQPQFVPWLGYLNKLNMADAFVFLDNVQFRKNEFQNRNRIGTPEGAQWLTVPVSFHFGDTINQVRTAQRRRWQRKPWRSVEQNYRQAAFFEPYGAQFHELLEQPWKRLVDINLASVRWLMECFEIQTPVYLASELPPCSEERTQRLVDICRHVGADSYLSGAQARCYLEVERFHAAAIDVAFQQFEHPTYRQCAAHTGFLSHLSALDGLFNCGGGAQGRELLNISSPDTHVL